MKTALCLSLMILLTSPLGSFALAKERTKETFRKLDKNKDGKLNLEEFSTGKRNKLKAKNTFEKLDRDDDKLLTVREYTA